MTGQRQHVELYRKLLLRRNLLPFAKNGAYYVPFIGDGDIACELYRKAVIFGADIDPARVATAKARLHDQQIIVADCDRWPFPDATAAFALAFDAYSDPYTAFRAFWAAAQKTDRLVLFFTDGHRQGLQRTGYWHKPDGTRVHLEYVNDRRKVFNAYFTVHLLPWFREYIRPWTIFTHLIYLRGMICYWGAVINHGK